VIRFLCLKQKAFRHFRSSLARPVLINNSNAITTRVGEMLRSGTDGTKGLYLEEVGGSVLANLMNSYVFEPASTLKVGVHLHTILQIRDNPVIYHTTLIDRYPPLVPPESCPTSEVIGQESIFDADRKMMRYSDNATTRELVDFFGESSINTTIASIFMTDSSINHVFGCGGPTPNETTLDDLATLYRGVVNGTLIDSYDRELFYLQMAGTYQFMQEGYDWTHVIDTDIPLIIDQEAPVGMPTVLKDAFEDDTSWLTRPAVTRSVILAAGTTSPFLGTPGSRSAMEGGYASTFLALSSTMPRPKTTPVTLLMPQRPSCCVSRFATDWHLVSIRSTCHSYCARILLHIETPGETISMAGNEKGEQRILDSLFP
jgi:hypothetical protein